MASSAASTGGDSDRRHLLEAPAQGTAEGGDATPSWAGHASVKVALFALLLAAVAGLVVAFRSIGSTAEPAPRLGSPRPAVGSAVLIMAPPTKVQSTADKGHTLPRYSLVSAGTFCDPDFYLWSGQEPECDSKCSATAACNYYTLYSDGWCQMVTAGGCDDPQPADNPSSLTYIRNAGHDEPEKVWAPTFELHSSGTFCDPEFYLWSGVDANCKDRCSAFENCTYFTSYQANSWCQLVQEGGCAVVQVADDHTAATYQKVPNPKAAAANAKAEAQAKAKAEAEAKARAEAQAKAKAKAEARVQALNKKDAAEAKAAAEARAKAEEEARARDAAAAKAAAQAKVKAEAKAKAEAEAKAEAKAEAAARAKARAEAEAEVKAKAKAEAERRERVEAEAKAKEEAEADKSQHKHGAPNTTTTTTTTIACAGSGQDCRESKCCALQGMQCYEKDKYWASCQASCISEGTGWKCKELGKRSPQKTWATWPGEDCSATRLCASPENKCYRKDVMTAYCASGPDPAWDNEIIGDHRWEYPVQAETNDTMVAAGDSLFCFMAVLRGSNEEWLESKARELGASIFSAACKANAVYDTSPSPFTVEGSWQSFVNTDAFFWVWMKVREDGVYKNYDWTVKVDPDTVFMPDRLQGKLWNLRAPKDKPVYIKNCDIGFGFLGAIEIISRVAVMNMLDNLDDCHRSMGSHSGEDGFVKGCLDAVGAGYMTDASILVSPHEASCGDGGRVAFHPHKDGNDWASCYFAASR